MKLEILQKPFSSVVVAKTLEQIDEPIRLNLQWMAPSFTTNCLSNSLIPLWLPHRRIADSKALEEGAFAETASFGSKAEAVP